MDHGVGTLKLNANYTFDLENLEHSRSMSQMKVMMEITHQGLSTSEVLKSINS